MNAESHPNGPNPDCACQVCRMLFPIEQCHYCSERAGDSFTLYDGTIRIIRYYCFHCHDALHREHEEMSARVPPEEFAAVRAANEITLARNIAQMEALQDDDEGDDERDDESNDDEEVNNALRKDHVVAIPAAATGAQQGNYEGDEINRFH